MKRKTILLGLNELNFDYINFILIKGFYLILKKYLKYKHPLKLFQKMSINF